MKHRRVDDDTSTNYFSGTVIVRTHFNNTNDPCCERIKKQASAIGVLEGFIYVLAIGLVFSDLSNYMNMIAYALGFGAGVYLGGMLEEKLAIGYVTIEANIPNKNIGLVSKLREVGFSVSTD